MREYHENNTMTVLILLVGLLILGIIVWKFLSKPTQVIVPNETKIENKQENKTPTAMPTETPTDIPSVSPTEGGN